MITERQIKNEWSLGKDSITLHDFIAIDSDQFQIYVGTDSQPYYKFSKFATTVCIIGENYSSFVVKRFKIKHGQHYSVEKRLMDEVYASILVANYLTKLKKGVSIEVHADINTNPKFRSFKCMAAAKGYVEGMGYKYVGKPDSWAASSCADWHTK